MEIFAEITGLKYTPLLCKNLENYRLKQFERALSKKANFILEIDNKNKMAVSWWVSPKRTRSYPYARVYDTLNFTGKKITIIPVIKDEGKDGDRDFLQWDTISLMSLLGVYVIISYYSDASKNPRYKNKITKQRFDIGHIVNEVHKLLSYQSDALHWNLSQIDNVYEIARKGLECYEHISKKLEVQMHSKESALKRINELHKGKERFMELSRRLAQKAQRRESITTQPKEHLTGIKAMITIKNYLGGYYYFTCDEIEIHRNEIYLIEGKHSKIAKLPSLGDIKDGLLKMVLFTNLKNVTIGTQRYSPIPILKLTTEHKLNMYSLSIAQRKLLEELKKEAIKNEFRIKINEIFFV